MQEWFTDVRYTVFCVESARGEAPVPQFLEKLKQENKKVAANAASAEAVIRRFAKTGIIRNNQKFIALGKGTVEFKAHQIRIFGVLHGTIKGEGACS